MSSKFIGKLLNVKQKATFKFGCSYFVCYANYKSYTILMDLPVGTARCWPACGRRRPWCCPTTAGPGRGGRSSALIGGGLFKSMEPYDRQITGWKCCIRRTQADMEAHSEVTSFSEVEMVEKRYGAFEDPK